MLWRFCVRTVVAGLPLIARALAARRAPARVAAAEYAAATVGERDLAATASAPLTVTVVYDNHAHVPGLASGWGFACHVSHGGHALLFDTGNDAKPLLANLRALALEPDTIGSVVLSHNHDDHTGGLAGLLAQTRDPRVFVPTSFSGQARQQMRDAGARVVTVGDPIEIATGVWSTGELGRNIREQALVLDSALGLVLITGCAHPGIVETVERAMSVLPGRDVHLVLGGFHLGGQSGTGLDEVITGLRRLGVRNVAPCHCTGERARAAFAAAFGAECVLAGAGWRVAMATQQ